MQPFGFRCRGPMWMSDETPFPGICKEEGIDAGDRRDSNGLHNRVGKVLMVNILWSYFEYGPLSVNDPSLAIQLSTWISTFRLLTTPQSPLTSFPTNCQQITFQTRQK
jgi:hypothetical protein